MAKVHVFNAGPCLLPQEVLDGATDAIREFAGTGVSLLSISHRTKEWENIMEETRNLWKELLKIPQDYEVVFLSSGASMLFYYSVFGLFTSFFCFFIFISRCGSHF